MSEAGELLKQPDKDRVNELKVVSDKKAVELGDRVDGLAEFNLGIQKDQKGKVVLEGRRPNHDEVPNKDNSAGNTRLIADTAPEALSVVIEEQDNERRVQIRKHLAEEDVEEGEEKKPKKNLYIDVSRKELPAIPSREYSETLIHELTHPVKTEVNGQNINAVIANADPEDSDGVANVFFGLWANKVNEGASLLRVAEIAHQSPRSRLYGFDMLSHGASGNLNAEQKKDLKEGNFESSVRPFLQMLKERGETKVRLFGSSLGGVLAVTAGAIAKEKYGIDVEVVGAYGMPIHDNAKDEIQPKDEKKSPVERILARLYGEQTARLMILDQTEGSSLDLYHSHAFDPRLMAMEGMDNSFIAKQAHIAKFFGKQFLQDPGMYYPKGLAKFSKEKLVELGKKFAKDNENGNMNLQNGSKDTISPSAVLNQAVDEIRAADPNNVRRITRQIRSGEGHLSMVQPIELGADIARNSMPLAKPPEKPPEELPAAA